MAVGTGLVQSSPITRSWLRRLRDESVFIEVSASERVVLRHVSGPQFEMTITFSAHGADTLVGWRQVFNSAAECWRTARFAVEANEQNLDRLAAQVLKVA